MKISDLASILTSLASLKLTASGRLEVFDSQTLPPWKTLWFLRHFAQKFCQFPHLLSRSKCISLMSQASTYSLGTLALNTYWILGQLWQSISILIFYVKTSFRHFAEFCKQIGFVIRFQSLRLVREMRQINKQQRSDGTTFSRNFLEIMKFLQSVTKSPSIVLENTLRITWSYR